MPNGRDRLEDRVRAALDGLARATDVLNGASDTGQWRDRINPEFMQGLETQILRLQQQLAPTQPAGSATDPLSQLTTDWGAFAAVRERAESSIRQCLALVSGNAVRSLELDGGTCAIADTLIAEINHTARAGWLGFTIMSADDEFLPTDEIVRVRFPPGDVWSLAASAHEFGHFATSRLDVAGEGLTRPRVFEGYLMELDQERRVGGNAAGLSGLEKRHYAEFFADAFATYAVGPAFACTALLVRFDPFTAHDQKANATHPSDLRRAHLILAILRKLTEGHWTRFSGVAAPLASQWRALIEESTSRADQPDDADVLTGMANRFWTMLQASRSDLQYKEWDRAQAMRNALEASGDSPPPADARVIDVLNSAWSSRLAGKQVSARAWSWCKTIAQRRASS